MSAGSQSSDHVTLEDVEGRVDGWRLADVEQEVWVLEHVHPETQRQAVVIPRVDVRLIVSHVVTLCLSLQEVEQVLDAGRHPLT